MPAINIIVLSVTVAMIFLRLTALTAYIMYNLQVLTLNFSFFLFCAPSFILFFQNYTFYINYIWMASSSLPCNPNTTYEMLLPPLVYPGPCTYCVWTRSHPFPTPHRPIPHSSSYLLRHTYTGTNMGQL